MNSAGLRPLSRGPDKLPFEGELNASSRYLDPVIGHDCRSRGQIVPPRGSCSAEWQCPYMGLLYVSHEALIVLRSCCSTYDRPYRIVSSEAKRIAFCYALAAEGDARVVLMHAVGEVLTTLPRLKGELGSAISSSEPGAPALPNCNPDRAPYDLLSRGAGNLS